MEWIALGRLGAPFGVRGWLHVDSHTRPPTQLLDYPDWGLRLASGERQLRRLSSGRAHGKGLVAQLEGVTDRDAAAALTGAMIEVERSRLPAPKEREFYRADLVGFAVSNLEGAPLGVVSHFVDTPGAAVMVVKADDGGEHWVLAHPKHLRKVDLAARTVLVDWPVESHE
ncbi:MAG TPA: ribosome maturation factor RimM [Steroidobacteraceae bacterium]|nr:ribosome maturation factor RimM [Steroidobacteraceae bacterium]